MAKVDRAKRRRHRKQDILETLVRQLEKNPGMRVTTASLARHVGVSEAALYRHFASKAKMFEALIDFAETSVFGLINRILADETNAMVRCEKILHVLLGFAERNPGITRVLVGDALVGENVRLRMRVVQFFDRLETQFKQILRAGDLEDGTYLAIPVEAAALQMLALVEGALCRFIRGAFKNKPTKYFQVHCDTLRRGIFR